MTRRKATFSIAQLAASLVAAVRILFFGGIKANRAEPVRRGGKDTPNINFHIYLVEKKKEIDREEEDRLSSIGLFVVY